MCVYFVRLASRRILLRASAAAVPEDVVLRHAVVVALALHPAAVIAGIATALCAGLPRGAPVLLGTPGLFDMPGLLGAPGLLGFTCLLNEPGLP